ncbi:MAG: YiiX/YebB-like N1pC/P60 family cysteine hydrolase [Flavobacteriales bacterium]
MKQGDLLFQNTGDDEVENAIKSVTATSKAKNYSHVGIAMQEKGNWFVLEAITKAGVTKTPLNAFLDRNKNRNGKSQTTVARLDSYYNSYIPKALEYGLTRLDLSYDKIFLWNDSSYYCSELVYKMFSSQDLLQDSLPFLTNPMTFNDSSGNPLPSWVNYYEKLNHSIPEGMTGTNPNLMASSPRLSFIFDYEKD